MSLEKKLSILNESKLDNIIYELEVLAFPWPDEENKTDEMKEVEMNYIIFKNNLIIKYDLLNPLKEEINKQKYQIEIIKYLKESINPNNFNSYINRLKIN